MIKIECKNRFSNLTFDDFTIDKENKDLVFYLKQYIEKIKEKISNCENIILCGSVGVGKTMLAKILQNTLSKLKVVKTMQTGNYNNNEQKYDTVEYEEFFNCEYISARELIKQLRRHFDKSKSENYEYHNCDFLIIDEIGIQYNTDAERIVLCDLINYRYENFKPIMIISNHELNQKDKNKALGLDKILGLRIIDRLYSNKSRYFYIKGKSKRR